jgi:hypothetical protein
MNFVILSVKTGIGEDNTKDLEEGRGKKKKEGEEERRGERKRT